MDITSPTGLVAWGLLWLVVVVGVFLLLRMFWLWYWKVDVITTRLTEIRDELRAANTRSGRAQAAQRPASLDAAEATLPANLRPSPQARARM